MQKKSIPIDQDAFLNKQIGCLITFCLWSSLRTRSLCAQGGDIFMDDLPESFLRKYYPPFFNFNPADSLLI